jgi:hypothetical protein
MLKFFRKIRQNLLMENKTGKYFKYAIGEIILVVIGILIALQINNWNQNRIQLKQEQKILLSLKTDFIESKVRLLKSMGMQKDVVRKGSELIKIYEGKIPRPINDSITNFLLAGVNGFYRAELLTGAYDAFINAGNSELIRNDKLIKMLAEYFSIVESGFEDQETSTNLQNNMQTIIAPFGVELYYSPIKQNFFGLDTVKRPKEDMAIDFLFKQDAFFGNLIHRMIVEYIRYSIQEEMLVKIDEILLVLNNEIKTTE